MFDGDVRNSSYCLISSVKHLGHHVLIKGAIGCLFKG